MDSHRKNQVASFTDAWIETIRPSVKRYEQEVASFTDAWIETDAKKLDPVQGASHLLQMRGLKH